MKRLIAMNRWLGWLTLILLAVSLWLVFNAPIDYQQGNSVRILYIHVPSAKMALFVYLALTVFSIWYLWKKSETADILVEASAPVGAAFALVTLASGSIWGKPMWGTWWAWDARLTSMLVLLILYMGIIAIRNGIDDPVKGARATAVLAIFGAVDLPIIHFSVVWWRTLHQPPSFGKTASAGPAITGPLLPPLLWMSLTFFLLGAYLILLKARETQGRRTLEHLEAQRRTHV
ncbi:MAG: cytochrome c biogenesis protein CcsA [Magnetococcales bacterium]|nr:cytochrome c biogenesis protein CcsA [Magnetococcales bacterium]MBF0174123.1 cytochrome c biogenesis protein CcsA [Magnetococcales bacterium]MBF0632006.1 cytochrome c biogenesis protein CcsA [Magnetococcales bacterium]